MYCTKAQCLSVSSILSRAALFCAAQSSHHERHCSCVSCAMPGRFCFSGPGMLIGPAIATVPTASTAHSTHVFIMHLLVPRSRDAAWVGDDKGRGPLFVVATSALPAAFWREASVVPDGGAGLQAEPNDIRCHERV